MARLVEDDRRDEDGLPIYKVFGATVKKVKNTDGRLLVQLTTRGVGWLRGKKYLHANRMLPQTAIEIGEALVWSGAAAMREQEGWSDAQLAAWMHNRNVTPSSAPRSSSVA
jgi:hypothetical protein